MYLYNIDLKLRNLLDDAYQIAAENSGEIPFDLYNQIEALEIKKETLQDAICKETVNLAAMSEMYEAQIKKFQAWKKTCDNAIQFNKEQIRSFIPEGEKVQTENYKISWSISYETIIEDADKLPEKFFRFIKEPIKGDIKKAVKSGEIPQEVAHVLTKKNIQIK